MGNISDGESDIIAIGSSQTALNDTMFLCFNSFKIFASLKKVSLKSWAVLSSSLTTTFSAGFYFGSYFAYLHRFLVEIHCTFARSFNEHPHSLSLRTLICNTFILSRSHVSKISRLKLKREVSWKEKKVQDCDYRKIPQIGPGDYIFQRPFLKGLFLEGLIFGGAYLRREICVSKSIGLAV